MPRRDFNVWFVVPQIALDTELAHVMAPGASLYIDLAADNGDSSLETAIGDVVNNILPTGGVFSNSWSHHEMCSTLSYKYECDSSFRSAAHPLFVQAALQGISTFFSTGDHGAQPPCSGLGCNTIFTVEYPAADPFVTAVGGTSITCTGCTETGDLGSGGGYSQIYPTPDYQSALSISGRGVPDVSMEFDPGASTYCNEYIADCNGWEQVGGTSLATPLWAGTIADLNQATGQTLGFLNYLLYQTIYPASEYSKDFHDVKTGNNGYAAGTGWDAVTGIGTPDLFKMAQNRGMTTVSVPSSVTQGQSLTYSGRGFTPSTQVQIVIWTDGTGLVVGTPTSTSTGTISGDFPVGTNIPTGQRKITFTDQSTGYVATTAVQVNPAPSLSVGLVSPPSPANGVTVTSSPVTLEARVTSGSAVQGASVTIYVDGSSPSGCSGTSDSSGYFSCSYSPSQSGHTYSWYATASKSGYNNGQSSNWSFTYSPTLPSLSVGLVSPPSPANGVTVTSSPVTLEARVTSGSAVQGASVTIYVDGSSPSGCSGTSDSSGYFSCSYSPSQSGHTYSWYGSASKSGYTWNIADLDFHIYPVPTLW